MTPAVVLAALLSLSPAPAAHPFPGWAEDAAAHHARLTSIADDIAAVATTPREVALAVGIGWHESGFARDVDVGPCYRGPGFESRCDGGRAWGLWQLQGRGVATLTRREQVAEALTRAHRSERACRANPLAERLAAYAGGGCLLGRETGRALDAAVQRAQRALDAAVALARGGGPA